MSKDEAEEEAEAAAASGAKAEEGAKPDDPDETEAEDRLAPVLKMMESGNMEAARKALMKMLKDDPNDAVVLHNLGVAFTEESRYQEAEEKFLQAWELQKSDNKVNYATMFGLATVLTEQGETGKLLQAEALFHDFLERAIAQEEKGIPETYRGFVGLADNLERQKRWTEASQAWTQVLELATPMFGQSHERTVEHQLRLKRAERLARWQRNMRMGIWTVTILVPLTFGWTWYRSAEQTAFGQAWGMVVASFGFGGGSNATQPLTAEL
mmetsp:Transcript_36301/g.67525  ORF Transcript_36301/g.67525 Transcript_36301/m.67525 type:complete len:268 (-) Transcript_36301:33-836(-)